MLSLVYTEFIKLKRKAIVLIVLLIAVLPPLINSLYTLNLPDNSPINADFRQFFQSEFVFIEWILLPCALAAVSSVLFFSERENRTLKELLMLPVNKSLYILSKFIIILCFSAVFMLLTALCTYTAGIVLSYNGMTADVLRELANTCLKTGILTAFAMLPIILITVIADKGYILSTCATLIYCISGLTFTSDLMGLHPLSSAAGIIAMNNTCKNQLLCVSNIAILPILSLIICVFVLKKQNH